jgi:chromosome segregation ATPase
VKPYLQLSLIFLCLSGGILALRLSGTMSSVGKEANSTLQSLRKDADDLKQMTSATLFQVGDASHEVAEMAREQKDSWQQSAEQTTAALRKTNQVLDQLTLTIKNVDASQAAITGNVNQALGAIPLVLTEAQKSLTETQKTLTETRAAIDSLNKVIQDPNIPQTFAHVNEVSGHLDSMSNSLDVAVKRWTKPTPIWKSLVLGGLDGASKVAILAK